mmetsp:Transcript_24720/g.21954  ORF Transcript_24720/g.21954 Transcript_24720/m.21954 type:complete len:299 (-) Transcript_24720:3-899(-)
MKAEKKVSTKPREYTKLTTKLEKTTVIGSRSGYSKKTVGMYKTEYTMKSHKEERRMSRIANANMLTVIKNKRNESGPLANINYHDGEKELDLKGSKNAINKSSTCAKKLNDKQFFNYPEEIFEVDENKEGSGQTSSFILDSEQKESVAPLSKNNPKSKPSGTITVNSKPRSFQKRKTICFDDPVAKIFKVDDDEENSSQNGGMGTFFRSKTFDKELENLIGDSEEEVDEIEKKPRRRSHQDSQENERRKSSIHQKFYELGGGNGKSLFNSQLARFCQKPKYKESDGTEYGESNFRNYH